MRNANQDQIIEIAVELQEVLPDPTDVQILDAIEDCIGREPSEQEARLAIVAYEQGEQTAKKSIWYTW